MTPKSSPLNKTTENVVLKKRGRKPKKDAEQNASNIIMSIEEKTNKENINNFTDNCVISYEDIDDNIKTCDKTIEIKPKKPEKPEKPEKQSEDENLEEPTNLEELEKNEATEDIDEICLSSEQKPFAKKRGRKPKGGKIIQHIVPSNNNKEPKPNVILHLKCFFKDLQTNTFLNQNIECFNPNNNLSYEIINNTTNTTKNNFIVTAQNNDFTTKKTSCEFSDNANSYDECCDYKNNKQSKDNDMKELWKKLKQLEHNLHINNISDKKSACFWCTYEFDNPPVYIPKHFIKETYNVYGCFCSPECATAYLMEENIDSSSKFERYYLINHIYAKIYNYNKNIKPAPNPYYLLDKYYGNLSIQEYRSLFKNERLFLVVDKPLTRILPELHEDNDDFIINNKIIPSNTSSSAYQIKKKMQKSQLKTNMLTEKFGF
jgi:hypothetical protein